MLNRVKNNRDSGFTIIEVLIVLAIAGLIMLIVFLAVPNLQRNSRNTQRRNDVSTILGSVQEVVNNNSGSVAAITVANIRPAAGNLSYYDISGANLSVRAGAHANDTTADTVTIQTGATCSGSDAVAGQARQIALLYSVENNTATPTHVCTNS